jgi:hypothetical protein
VHREEISAALEALRGKADVEVLLASDRGRPERIVAPQIIKASSKDFREELRDALESVPYRGGQDDAPALNRALETTQGSAAAAILWFHGPQPLRSLHLEAFIQRVERLKNIPPLYDVELAPGKNTIVEALDRYQILRRAPSTADELAVFMAGLAGSDPVRASSRTRVDAGSAADLRGTHQTSDHLARLWAADEVRRLLRTNERQAAHAATMLAAAYGIVTPLTGAVVLETQAQYEAAGLTPANPLEPGSVPTIPEPETYLLLGISGLVLLMMFAKRERSGRWHIAVH